MNIDPRHIRKRGSDMAKSLLYAMFAIVIIIDVMALYGTVRLNQSKQQAVQIMTTAALEARQAHKGTTFAGLTTQSLIERGAVPASAVIGSEPNQSILLPYGGVVNIVPTFLNDGFSAYVVFNNSSWQAHALCFYLASGQRGTMIDGPMGSDYSLDIEHCNDETYPSFNVLYNVQSHYVP